MINALTRADFVIGYVFNDETKMYDVYINNERGSRHIRKSTANEIEALEKVYDMLEFEKESIRMGKIKEKRNNSNTVYYYKISKVLDSESALKWIYEIINLRIIEINYISLNDINNNSDDGNTSKQLQPNISEEELKESFKEGNIDTISITGEYENKPIVIGIDFREYREFITIRNNKPADYISLAKKLDLDE